MLKDPVPKNVSKFPIHQTYLTDDAQPTGTGGYKFKCPEVWSSARSAKKSIAIRSIQWQSKSELLQFTLRIFLSEESEHDFDFSTTIPPRTPLNDILNMINDRFNEWITGQNVVLITEYDPKESKLSFGVKNYEDDQLGIFENIQFTAYNDSSKPSESLNRLLNQPLDYFPAKTDRIDFYNVWDRSTSLNFHASFVPFDNYQYLGAIFDKWNEPIIYQDANASPLFNVWITTNLKTPIKLLYESFIIRITFIIATDSQYHS